MSGTQSTLTDRTPSILNKDPADKKPKNDKSSVSLKHEFDPTGLVQRCVIIQRDENGFGLTVSGDNPVFVQLVKEDGAAMRAGVQTGDRIIKVNGTLVTHSNHIEVVKLIKSGSYVALTVLGRPPGLPQIPLEEEEEEEKKEEGAEVSPPSSVSVPHSPALSGVEKCSPQEHITTSRPDGDENKTTHSQKIDSLQKMINKQQLDLQAKEEECSRNPRPKLLKEIQEAKKHISQLQEQLSRAASQDGATVSRNGEAEEGDSGPPARELTSPSRGDSANDRPSTNSNSVVLSDAIENWMPRRAKIPTGHQAGDKDATSSPDTPAPPASINAFDGMKSEDEEEELAAADRQDDEEVEDEEVDEAELEAFLDGQLADIPFLQQEGSRQGIAIENQEHSTFGIPSSKAEDALRTLAMLKQALFNHMMSREAEEEKEETEENKQSGCQLSASSPGSPEGGPSAACDESRASASLQKDDPQLPSAHTGLTETTERNGGFVVLDFNVGCEESSTDDDGGLGGDMGIDMRKLLSSSSQAGGGGGPNLSRQLMTHLRLLQADLQYLKEVEIKYNELRQPHIDMATDSDDNTDGIQ
ncbi:rho guanine nucleotide exchange factor 12-like protein [Lates japonicus]|uniref:Rho guanine nucleotide exchange factor 12-like protein n=1 Tax=Lates japonicus TaxID=270547 RepID=A0AAD3QWR9_LATJO|nr:rho guanine nucleotide exchange factor 12-like protein [Lates japonicus]